MLTTFLILKLRLKRFKKSKIITKKGNECEGETTKRNADFRFMCSSQGGGVALADLTKYFKYIYLGRVRAIATSRHIKDSPSILWPKKKKNCNWNRMWMYNQD